MQSAVSESLLQKDEYSKQDSIVNEIVILNRQKKRDSSLCLSVNFHAGLYFIKNLSYKVLTVLKRMPLFVLFLFSFFLFSTTAYAYVDFSDDFERPLLGSDWTASNGSLAEIGTLTSNSGTNSLNTHSGFVTVTSRTFDLSSDSSVSLTMWIRRGDDSFSEDPDDGEDLSIQYFNSSSNWVTIASYPGTGINGQTYNLSHTFNADAYHAGFQLRIRQAAGDAGTWDYWHIDDVVLKSATPPPDHLITPDTTINEADGTINYIVYINATATGSLNWSTSDGTATAGSDYNASSGTFAYAAGDHTYSLSINILEDSNIESDETFTISFTQASGSITLPATDPVITIEDNDGAESGEGNRDFVVVNPIETRNIIGNIKTIGNTNLCITTGTSSFGACETGSSTATDNERYVQYINVENNDSDPTITVINDGAITSAFNSSAAPLNIQPTNLAANGTPPEIVWAGLFWQGSIHTWDWGSHESWLNGQEISNITLINPTQFHQDEILFHTPQMAENEYVKIRSNGYYDIYNVYHDDYGGDIDDGGVYSVFTDVTDVMQTYGDLANPNGMYKIANLQTMNGRENNLGNYGGWALVVIYENSDDLDELLRNVTVHSGYTVISAAAGSQHHSTITISDFSTPKDTSKPIDSTVSLFIGEAEKYSGDYGKIYATDIPPYTEYDLTDGFGSTTNLYRGIISGVPGRVENYPNTDGIDIRNFNTGTTGNGAMQHDQHRATIKIGTSGDTYFPSMVSFATELYRPDICYDYSISQNKFAYNVEVPSNNIPQFTDFVDDNYPLEVSMYFKNRTADINADSLYYNPRDFNTTQINLTNNVDTSPTYSPVDGLQYYDYSVAKANVIPDPDNFDGTETEFYIAIGHGATALAFDGTDGSYISGGGELGYNEGVFVKYHLMPQDHEMDFPIKGYLYYNFISAGKPAFSTPVELRIGVDLPRCEGASRYQPKWGQFTIIDRNYQLDGTYDNTTPSAPYAHNLRTQVANRPFQVDVVSLEENVAVAGGWDNLDNNASVIISVLDAKHHEMNTTVSCVKPTLFDGTEPIISFGGGSRAQINDYLSINRAMENAAFSIFFLEDNASALIEGWSCASTADAACWDNVYLSKISPFDTSCASECTGSSGTECSSCLLRIHMKTLCSRDNFAVRPEAIDIYAVSDIDNNTTDIAVHQAQRLRIPAVLPKLSAEYTYAYDINATSYTSRSALAGYRPTFDQVNVYSKFIWDTNLTLNPGGCPDPADENATVRFTTAGGSYNELSVGNVGHYQLEIVDQNWTDRDKVTNAAHHFQSDGVTPVPGFSAANDCVIGSNAIPTVANITGFTGCDIRSTYTKNADNWTDGGVNISVGAYNYINKSVDVRPYDFDIGTNRLNYSTRIADANGTEGFIYMNPLDDNTTLRMSLFTEGRILRAVGYPGAALGGNSLTNYVDGCHAQPMDLELQNVVNRLEGTEPFIYRMHEHNSTLPSSSVRNNTGGILTTGNSVIALPTTAWVTTAQQGEVKLDLYYNFDRNVTGVQNPNIMTFDDFNVTCTNSSDCNSTANSDFTGGVLNYDTHSPESGLDLNATKLYIYYGRVHAPRYRIEDSTGTTTHYYEVYCDGCTIADHTFALPNQLLSVDDIRWYRNEEHNLTAGVDGNVTFIQERPSGTDKIAEGFIPGSNNQAVFIYNETAGYPFKSTMQMSTQNFLLFNRFNPAASTNNFELEFNSAGNVAGKNITIKGSDANASKNTSRRIQW